MYSMRIEAGDYFSWMDFLPTGIRNVYTIEMTREVVYATPDYCLVFKFRKPPKRKPKQELPEIDMPMPTPFGLDDKD